MKTLISASVIKESVQNGNMVIEFTKKEFIVTPEAFEVARELGLNLLDVGETGQSVKKDHFSCGIKPNLFPLSDPILPTELVVAPEVLKQIRLAVIAQLPTGSIPEVLIDQIVMKVIKERDLNSPVKQDSGVRCISGKNIVLGAFPGETPVGIADAITGAHGSPMASGFMAWENHAFPWLLTYDEIIYVIEGELHLRCAGELTIVRAGDVLYIPKNSKVEFGTPTNVKFFYVTHPANWQDS